MASRGVFSGRIADPELFRCIVACRRNHDVGAWQTLRALVEANPAGVCADTDTRWLVAICDTYADYGTPVERAAAMVIVTLVSWEKMAQTLRAVDGSGAVQPQRGEQRQAPLWDGVTSVDLALHTYDMPRNWARRASAALEPVPVLQCIYRVVLSRLTRADGSTVALLNRVSVHRDLPHDLRGASE